jgi:hypothetical protein
MHVKKVNSSAAAFVMSAFNASTLPVCVPITGFHYDSLLAVALFVWQ